MPAIGYVTKLPDNQGYRGTLRTLKLRAPIEIVPNPRKTAENHPDFLVLSQQFECGAGWSRKNEETGEKYVSLSLAAPELGPKKLYANLGRAAGQDDDDTFAIIWNPRNED
jgi:uncharacterized protein (DUF736 family)